jgi:hypothetical protein
MNAVGQQAIENGASYNNTGLFPLQALAPRRISSTSNDDFQSFTYNIQR